uniref:E3 ubiquitin/ISG15 ligase TRIM25-like n=1 Tax=Myxine glutinosa TaxID=7769 RepID=UPI00358EE4F5
MAAASSSSAIGDGLDELACPVCFDLYKEPVTLPCGHSFCHVCIEKYWESREANTARVCPNCRGVLPKKTKLKKNVIITNLVEKIKSKKVDFGLGVDVRNTELGDVKSGCNESHCELCYREVAKRCVPCEILCCEQHLKPHQQKGHKLVDPGVKIEELKCIEHGKTIQLYCKDDESFMCVTCTGDEHPDHKIVDVEIVHTELKDVLAAKYPLISESMQTVASQLQQVQEEKEQTENFSKDAEDRLEEKRRLVCQLVNESVDLMKSEINERKMEKLSVLGQQREILEMQMEALRRLKSTMDSALQELQAISFIQDSKNLLKGLEAILAIEFVRTTPLPVLDFSKEEKNLNVLVNINNNFLKTIQKGSMEHLDMVDLDQNNLRNLYGRTLSLDPNSANRQIEISGDLRTATLTRTENPYPEHPDRFDYWGQVVSRESFSSGRHYWEVNVRSSRFCDVGIGLSSMERKGEDFDCIMGMNPESWFLGKCQNKYSAKHNGKYTDLSMPRNPKLLGFFLDCEAGELMCFGDSRVLHVFRGNFMGTVKPAIAVYNGSVRFSPF